MRAMAITVALAAPARRCPPAGRRPATTPAGRGSTSPSTTGPTLIVDAGTPADVVAAVRLATGPAARWP